MIIISWVEIFALEETGFLNQEATQSNRILQEIRDIAYVIISLLQPQKPVLHSPHGFWPVSLSLLFSPDMVSLTPLPYCLPQSYPKSLGPPFLS